MIELYDFNNSVCAQKVRMTLAEKGLDFAARDINLFKGEQYAAGYLKLNPKGYVPTIVHDGRAVTESTLICEYVDEVFPEPPLSPPDAYGRAKMRLWPKAVDEGLHAGITAISFSAMFRERMREMWEDERERRYRNIGDPVRRDRHRSTYEEGVESPFVFRAIAAYEAAFRTLEETLGHGGDWVMGKAYTLADIDLAPYVARLDYLTLIDVWCAKRPRVQAWWDRVQVRPSFVAELSGPLTDEMITEMRESGAQIRDRVAERREEYLEGF